MPYIARRATAFVALCAGLAVALLAALGSAFLRRLGFSSQSWVTSAALVALVSMVIAAIYYYRTLKLSARIADRAVTVEAQKLLLEVNKVLVADPRLFAIYKEGDELRVLEDSLSRCPVICDLLELKEAGKIYHPNLMAAFRLWREGHGRAPVPANRA